MARLQELNGGGERISPPPPSLGDAGGAQICVHLDPDSVFRYGCDPPPKTGCSCCGEPISCGTCSGGLCTAILCTCIAPPVLPGRLQPPPVGDQPPPDGVQIGGPGAGPTAGFGGGVNGTEMAMPSNGDSTMLIVVAVVAALFIFGS